MTIVKEEHLLDLLAKCYPVIKKSNNPQDRLLLNVVKFVLHVAEHQYMGSATGAGMLSATGTETTTSDMTFVPGIGLVHAPAKETDHA